jgi:hypothetical protein
VQQPDGLSNLRIQAVDRGQLSHDPHDPNGMRQARWREHGLQEG